MLSRNGSQRTLEVDSASHLDYGSLAGTHRHLVLVAHVAIDVSFNLKILLHIADFDFVLWKKARQVWCGLT